MDIKTSKLCRTIYCVIFPVVNMVFSLLYFMLVMYISSSGGHFGNMAQLEIKDLLGQLMLGLFVFQIISVIVGVCVYISSKNRIYVGLFSFFVGCQRVFYISFVIFGVVLISMIVPLIVAVIVFNMLTLLALYGMRILIGLIVYYLLHKKTRVFISKWSKWSLEVAIGDWVERYLMKQTK